jgi:hypothetical protein
MGIRRVTYSLLVGRPEVRRPFGRPRRKGRIILNWDLKEVSWDHGLDLSGSG